MIDYVIQNFDHTGQIITPSLKLTIEEFMKDQSCGGEFHLPPPPIIYKRQICFLPTKKYRVIALKSDGSALIYGER